MAESPRPGRAIPVFNDVVVSQLTKRFGAVAALDAVDLTIRSGELFGLIGPDGAGKTTLLRILATLLQPSSGQATLFGHPVTGPRSHITPRIGYLPQRFSLYPELTVAENLELFAKIRGVPKAHRKPRAEGLLERVGLAGSTEHRAGSLSDELKQKLMLAGILLHQPDLLLLDEPTTGLDPDSRQEIWELLAELHTEGKTILTTTPYLDEAERCSRVGFISAGRITQVGTPAQLVSRVSGQLYRITTPQLQMAQRTLEAVPQIVATQLAADSLLVLTRGLSSLDLGDELISAAVPFDDIRPAPRELETAFIHLTGAAS
jgi:ABC-2 type transport system ATP-binding protein